MIDSLSINPTLDYKKLLIYPDSDNIRIKGLIKKTLLESPDILYLLNAAEPSLEPEGYFNKYILPFLIADNANTDVRNCLCYETSFSKRSPLTQVCKRQHIIFYIYIDREDAIEPSSGIPRHDLLAHFITAEINWSHVFGPQCRLVSDRSGRTDLHYITRTLTFETELPNCITHTDAGTGRSYIINSDDPKVEDYA